MSALARIDRALRRAEGWGALALLVAIVALVAAASLARALGAPIIWSVEVAQLLFVWLCIFAADLAMQRDRHFGLSFLVDALSPRAARRLAILNHAVLAILLAFLLFHAWRNMILMHPRLIGATQMHGSWLHGSMVAGFALMLRTMLTNLWRLAAAPAEAPAPSGLPARDAS
ncbi:TRAP transporter small permease subunit [uncultured Albimonas sp.]|uniref:TRAP transporter small permease n=1 Tax=uncultured Albimonas sp. TaxID=1331701 RepID=UPI0030EE4469|tara:strand:- start:689 stop:1204 length:516 start_codon:yes stop_codon:yes gene_type:complete